MWIKICGLTTPEAALACAGAGVDAVGFVFAKSKRKITVEAARRIAALLPDKTEKVGVFVDALRSEVAETQRCLGLDLLQFHGSESPEYCGFFREKAIKAFRIASACDLEMVEAYRGKVRACLLDAYDPAAAGGTGKPWDWSLLSLERSIKFTGLPVIVAGGLTPQNVLEVLRVIKPAGVDTSSGVESAGRKDSLLIKQFVEAVRRWEKNELT